MPAIPPGSSCASVDKLEQALERQKERCPGKASQFHTDTNHQTVSWLTRLGGVAVDVTSLGTASQPCRALWPKVIRTNSFLICLTSVDCWWYAGLRRVRRIGAFQPPPALEFAIK